MISRLLGKDKMKMISKEDAMPGREDYAFDLATTHAVLGTPLLPPFTANLELAYFGMGCFWGAERLFWQYPGVYSTAVGYQGGFTPYPTYKEVCTGQTGHTEIVQVVYDPAEVSFESLARLFFEEHDPTQGMRQGGDHGTQYRSAIYTTTASQQKKAEALQAAYDPMLRKSGFGSITTEIAPADLFYYAEEYHQQYLHKVPHGYCGLDGTGVSCPVPWAAATETQSDTLPASEEDWRQRLTPEQYRVLREAGTERPYSSELNNVKADGMFRCAACGNALFDSLTKFESGTGWPSFTEAIPGSVEFIHDNSHGMRRTEVRCANCQSHLGHVFDDGPREAGGMRFCMNGCALDLEARTKG